MTAPLPPLPVPSHVLALAPGSELGMEPTQTSQIRIQDSFFFFLPLKDQSKGQLFRSGRERGNVNSRSLGGSRQPSLDQKGEDFSRWGQEEGTKMRPGLVIFCPRTEAVPV